MVFEYQRAESKQALEEGLGEYYASRDDLARGRGMSDRAREFFRCHDVAHVVFGCNTTLLNEAMVKIWSFFGTTAGLGLVREYRLPESQEIYRTLKWGDIASTGLRSTAVMPRVFLRCRRMHRRWPWSDFESHRGSQLLELRREFGIDVLTTV